MHEFFDLLESQLDDVGNKMELYLRHRNYFLHQSQYQVHLIQIQILLQNHVLLLDLQYMHHKVHVQYAPQQDEHGNDIDLNQQVMHRIHK